MTGASSALVTGATGFVGGGLVRALRERGQRVVAMVRPARALPEELLDSGADVVHLDDLRELPSILDHYDVDTVFHLAAHQSKGSGPADIDEFVEANIRLGMHLFAASAQRGARVVETQSYFQFRYGAPAAHSLYSATKQAQAEFARFWRERVGADIRDLVLFDNYGAGDRRDKLIPALIRAGREGVPLSIGPLDQLVDLLHVRDVAAGLIAAATGDATETLALRAPSLITVGTIIDEVSSALGAPVHVDVDPSRRASDHPAVAGEWPGPEGWQAEVTLQEGMIESVAAGG